MCTSVVSSCAAGKDQRKLLGDHRFSQQIHLRSDIGGKFESQVPLTQQKGLFCVLKGADFSDLHSQKLTYPLKMVDFNRNLLFQGSIIGGNASCFFFFQGGVQQIFSPQF